MHGPQRRSIPFLMLSFLSAGTLMNCNCETEQFLPSVTYDPYPFVSAVGEAPGTELVFGDVSVNSEKTLAIRVQSNGRAPVNVVAANLVSTSADGTWKVVVADELNPMVGIAPGQTATISVTFRPCPQAWDGNTLRENFDFNGCPGEGQAADLNVTDNTPTGAASFGLSGRAVQPPVASVFCPVANNCGEAQPQLRQCNGVTFGAVSSNEDPCDLVIEVRNQWRDNKPVGDLEIQKIDVLVQDYCCGDPGPILTGEDVGFTIEDMSGQPLTPDPADPFLVPITPGGTDGANQFKFVFSGARTGLWRGQATNMTGLRLYTNDPDHRLIVVPLTGQGSAPALQCSPERINFGPVPQNTTATATITCRNGGDADLTISNIAIESGNPEFAVTTDLGPTQNLTLRLFELVQLFVAYTPRNTGVDADNLVLTSNDPINPRILIPIIGGPIPEIQVQPADTLAFPLPVGVDPPFPPQTQPLIISNIGYGDLVVSRLELRGPNGMLDHPSVDDFTIPLCAGANPCDLNLTLCAPGSPGCNANFTKQLDVTYANDDISTIDLVELHIFSDAPSDPEHIVVLSAEDKPCLFPTPVITVTSPSPHCVGDEIMVDANASNPGPPGAMVNACTWFWPFVPMGMPPPFNTQGMLTTAFVPMAAGTFVLGVNCTNSCGATSQTPGQETILVSNGCGN